MYRFISRVIDRNKSQVYASATGIIDKSLTVEVTNKNRRSQLGRVFSDRVDTSDGPFLDKTTCSSGDASVPREKAT